MIQENVEEKRYVQFINEVEYSRSFGRGPVTLINNYIELKVYLRKGP
jgi:hypothetical protein